MSRISANTSYHNSNMFKIIALCALASSALAGYSIPSYSDYSGASLKNTYNAPSAYSGKEATSYAIVTSQSASSPVAYEAPSYPKAYSYSAPEASSGYGGESYGKAAEVDYYAEPKYQFKYGVEDPKTGDKKSQYEERDGDKTKGQYTVAEPDGTILTVDYTVAGKSGFNAIVSRSGKATHPEAAPAPAKYSYAVPEPLYYKGY